MVRSIPAHAQWEPYVAVFLPPEDAVQEILLHWLLLRIKRVASLVGIQPTTI